MTLMRGPTILWPLAPGRGAFESREGGPFMRTHSLVATLILLAAIGFGAGRLLAVATGPAQAPAVAAARPASTVSPAATPVPSTNPAPATAAEVAHAAPAPEPAPAPVTEQPAPKPTPERAPVQEAAAEVPAPAPSGLPREPGLPDGPRVAVPNAKPAPAPDAPKGFLPAPARGSDTPKATVVISSDFQCPVCRRIVEPVEVLIREVPDARVEFKQHALSSHRRAEAAALASLAAHHQGKFWQYHDLLFENQAALEDDDLERYAQQIGLDISKFRKDIADPTLLAQVRAESKAAELLGARGTPAFFINGKLQVGWGSYFGFKQMVLDEISAADAALKAGTPQDKLYEVRAMANSDHGADYVKYFIRGVPPEASAQ